MKERLNSNIEAFQKLKEEVKKIEISNSQLRKSFDSSQNFLESKMGQNAFEVFSNDFCLKKDFEKFNIECNQKNEQFSKIINVVL